MAFSAISITIEQLTSAALLGQLTRFRFSHMHVQGLPSGHIVRLLAFLNTMYTSREHAPPPRSVYFGHMDFENLRLAAWTRILRTMAEGVGEFKTFMVRCMVAYGGHTRAVL